MAANLDSVMTWEQACEQFASEILPHMQTIYEQDGKPDWPPPIVTGKHEAGPEV